MTIQRNEYNTRVTHYTEDKHTFVFSVNEDLLGENFCDQLREMIEDRLAVLKHSPWSFAKL